MTPRPPSSTLFPYTTLFRSRQERQPRQHGPLRGDDVDDVEMRLGEGERSMAKKALIRTAWVAAAIAVGDRKSTRLNSSHRCISYAVFCLKKKRNKEMKQTNR